MTDGWTWPVERHKRTSGVAHRFLVGSLPLCPLPGGKLVELRLYAKMWDMAAADPGSWCVDLMKFAANDAAQTMDPYQPLQHVQVSSQDWDTFFACWGPTGDRVLQILATLTGAIERLPIPVSAD